MLKALSVDNLRRIRSQFFNAIVVLAWRNECALGAPSLHHKVTLKLYRSLVELIKAFLFEQLPNLLLREALGSCDEFTLLRIKTIAESWHWRFELVAKWLEESNT